MNKSVQDFKEYIAYVVALYRIIKIRRNKVKIGDKKHHLEYRVLQRVKNLYEMAVQRFPQEVGLYFAFFQFCKEAAFQHATNKMCDMMIKVRIIYFKIFYLFIIFILFSTTKAMKKCG